MKRGLTLFLLGFLVLSSLFLVTAADSNNSSTNSSNNSNFLTEEVALPEPLQFPLKFILGIKEEKVIWRDFIILAGIWAMILIIISGVISATPIHTESIKDWILAVIITVIISITGSIAQVTRYWTSVPQAFFALIGLGDWMKGHPIISVILSVILLIILIVLASIFFKRLERHRRLEEARYRGEQVGTMNKMAKISAEALEDLANKK